MSEQENENEVEDVGPVTIMKERGSISTRQGHAKIYRMNK
jgi:hypothetical protein